MSIISRIHEISKGKSDKEGEESFSEINSEEQSFFLWTLTVIDDVDKKKKKTCLARK